MNDDAAAAGILALMLGGGIVTVLFVVLFVIFPFICMWKVFEKAGKPGWAGIVPVYNFIVLLELAGKPLWWVAVIMLVPCVNVVFIVLAYVAFAERFGKSGAFAVGMALLPFVFWPILAFDSSTFKALPTPRA